MAKAKRTHNLSDGSFRIIAGRWRSRRVPFPANAELRPTADRVRETLFNWLQPHIAGARVLDAFAGSGSLSLEALSRGAGSVTAWERDSRVCGAIEQNAHKLGLGENQRLQCQSVDSLAEFRRDANHTPFDIVLLDPPFRRDWWPAIFAALSDPQQQWLAPGALVYIEFERELVLPELPDGWEMWRQQTAGQVAGQLFTTP